MDRDELLVTARMARLRLSEANEEFSRFEAAVRQMLDYFSKMREMDVERLPPTTQLARDNRLREDVLAGEDLAEKLLQNAPELEDRFLAVPNVL